MYIVVLWEYWCDVSNLLKSNFSSLFDYTVCSFSQKTMPLHAFAGML